MSRIYTNLAVSSGIAVLLAMVSAGFVCREYIVLELVEVAEKRNIALAQALSNMMLIDFEDYLSNTETASDEDLLARAQKDELDRWLSALTQGLAILRVKIYNPSGRTIYSSSHDQIGDLKDDDSHFDTVAKLGEPLSEMSRRDSFSAFSGEVFDRDIIETYTPIRSAEGKIIGVFEIYTDITEVTKTIDRAALGILSGLLLVFLLLYGGLVFVIIRRAVAPLRLASQHAMAIGPRTPRMRLPLDGIPGEVLPLVAAINGALDRLDKALDSQRQFTADAAHELFTPLAVLRANLDTMADQEVAARLRGDVNAMTDIVSQLLELAGMDALDPNDGEPVNVYQVCSEVISSLAPIAYKQHKALSLSGEELPPSVCCCSKALGRAVRNLVDNAIVHTPANTTVEVNIGKDAAIHVIDAGPGVPLKDREHIFERFWRGERGARQGSGIGLSIVKSFVDAYGGSIEVGDAQNGGAVFTLRLPTVAERRGTESER